MNYMHLMIDWMGSRLSPYDFPMNYVAFWELSFLPSWVVTRVDLFFPLIALKSIVLIGLGAWLVGRELKLNRALLLWTVFGALLLQHLWGEMSGVATLKNDAIQGAGFVFLTLVVLRAAQRRLTRTDVCLMALGVALAPVKYTGIFEVFLAGGLVLFLQRRFLRQNLLAGVAGISAVCAVLVLTGGHYYLRTLWLHGSPFYPYQINVGFIHLPGTYDLSGTSILWSLHDRRLWTALFWPAHGISPAGLMFPGVLALTLVIGTVRLVYSTVLSVLAFRKGGARRWTTFDWAMLMVLAGWLLYFRSVFSASSSPGDLAFILSDLNTIRYVDGVLAVSDLLLVSLLARVPWLAAVLIAIQTASRLWILYPRIPAQLISTRGTMTAALSVLCVFLLIGLYRARLRGAVLAAVATSMLVAATPLIVQRHRPLWTAYWNDLKPTIASLSNKDLVVVAFPDGGWYAGQFVAAGNPFRNVNALGIWELRSMAPADRPKLLAVMISPYSPFSVDWQSHCGPELKEWGYHLVKAGSFGGVFERQ